MMLEAASVQFSKGRFQKKEVIIITSGGAGQQGSFITFFWYKDDF